MPRFASLPFMQNASPVLDGLLRDAIIEASHGLPQPIQFINGFTLDILHPTAIELATPQIIGPKIAFPRELQNKVRKAYHMDYYRECLVSRLLLSKGLLWN